MAKFDLNLESGYTAHRFGQETIKAAVMQPGSRRSLRAAFHQNTGPNQHPWLGPGGCGKARLSWCMRKDYFKTCNGLTLTWRSESSSQEWGQWSSHPTTQEGLKQGEKKETLDMYCLG